MKNQKNKTKQEKRHTERMSLFWSERIWAEEGWLASAVIAKVSAAVDVEPLTVYWIFFFLIFSFCLADRNDDCWYARMNFDGVSWFYYVCLMR